MKSGMQYYRPSERFWAGKRVLVTGHTGFKGSWLCLWLTELGAIVCGVGLQPETEPSLYESGRIGERIAVNRMQDIRDPVELAKIIKTFDPEVVFHLAAQAIVLDSYENPLYTFEVNTLGTCNVLNALLSCTNVRSAVFVTTDKVYENQGGSRPFKETDPLGGHDPYSASKAACEIAISSYRRSYFEPRGVGITAARAGNVIGGGDWSRHRLIPDAIRAWDKGEPIKVRRPHAIRPWQHVLEPLAGYLCLAERVWSDISLAAAYNFGPIAHDTASVSEVLSLAKDLYGDGVIEIVNSKEYRHEALELSLDVSLASDRLGFQPRWDLGQSLKATVDWYRLFKQGCDPGALCKDDFEKYCGKS